MLGEIVVVFSYPGKNYNHTIKTSTFKRLNSLIKKPDNYETIATHYSNNYYTSNYFKIIDDVNI